MKYLRSNRSLYSTIGIFVFVVVILAGCDLSGKKALSSGESGDPGQNLTTTTTIPFEEEVEVPVSVSIPSSAKGLGDSTSRAITGMTVKARSFDSTTRVQQGTDRTLTESTPGTYTGYVSIGAATSSSYFIHIFGSKEGKVEAQGTLANYTSGAIAVPYNVGYAVGDFGPTGGMIVAADTGNKLYTELAPLAWNGGTDPAYTWGRNVTNVSTSTASKEGVANVDAIKSALSDTWTKIAGISIANRGSGYSASNTLTLTGGDGNGTATVSEVTNGIATATINARGTGYSVNNTLTLTGGGSDGNGQVNVTQVTNAIATVSVANQGTTGGYKVNDILTLTGGGSDGNGQVTVTAVVKITGKNYVSAVSLTTPGTGYSAGTTYSTSGGGGGGATITVNTVTAGLVKEVSFASAGTGYSASTSYSTTVTPAGGSGATVIVNTVTSGLLKTITINTAGTSYAVGAYSTTVVPAGGTNGTVNVDSVDTLNAAITKFRSAVSFNGYSDWTWPAKGDLDAVGGLNGTQRTAIGLTDSNVYWSSSQGATSTNAYALTIGNASCAEVSKQTSGYYVRPVRYF